MLKRLFGFLAVGTALTAAVPAEAGFTATLSPTRVITNFGTNGTIDVGDTFTTSIPGSFSLYVPDSSSDPQINGTDLANYRFTFDGAVSAIAGNVLSYAGAYELFYNLNVTDNTRDLSDIRVSAGTFNISATFTAPGVATVSGQLNQNMGPANPAFADLSYGGNPVNFILGTYAETPGSGDGILNGALRQGASALVAPVPEPATLASALFGVGLLGLAAIRRRK